jgi:hypothetical protein
MTTEMTNGLQGFFDNGVLVSCDESFLRCYRQIAVFIFQLSTVLLYRFERPQYYVYLLLLCGLNSDFAHMFISQDFFSGENPPAASEVYGAEHLARLLGTAPANQ